MIRITDKSIVNSTRKQQFHTYDLHVEKTTLEENLLIFQIALSFYQPALQNRSKKHSELLTPDIIFEQESSKTLLTEIPPSHSPKCSRDHLQLNFRILMICLETTDLNK